VRRVAGGREGFSLVGRAEEGEAFALSAIPASVMEWFAGLDRNQVESVIEFAVRSLDKPPATPARARLTRIESVNK
jgi:hypothetical protein